jgi:gas vesicle protein
MNESITTYRGFNAGHMFLALFAGAAAGAGVAYLTAPYSGAATRNRLRTMAHDTNEAAHLVPEAVRKATEAARDAFISALELEGEAEAEPVLVVNSKRRARDDHASA